MASSTVVISPELLQLPLKIDRIPEKHAIKALAPDRPDQPFDERMRNRDVRNRFDRIDLQNPQVGEPPVKAKQRIVVSAEVFRWWLTRGCVIEHSANRDSINVCGLDTEADDAAAKDIHDQHHPMAAQQDRFDTEQIDALQAVLGVANEGQPGWTVGSGMVRTVVLGEHAAHDIFVDLYAKGVSDLLGDAQAAEHGIAPFHLHDCRDEFRGRPLGPGLPRGAQEENRSRYFRYTNALWNLSSVVALRIADSFGIRWGL